jgi:hypothetical protein
MRMSPLLVAVSLVTAAVAGCSSSGSDGTLVSSDAGSCAVVIGVAGAQYIGGRQSESVLPVTGETLKAERLDCDDSGSGQPSTTSIVATRIRGVPVADAVAAQGYQLMLSQRLWRVAWKDLLPHLKPYVERDSA